MKGKYKSKLKKCSMHDAEQQQSSEAENSGHARKTLVRLVAALLAMTLSAGLIITAIRGIKLTAFKTFDVERIVTFEDGDATCSSCVGCFMPSGVCQDVVTYPKANATACGNNGGHWCHAAPEMTTAKVPILTTSSKAPAAPSPPTSAPTGNNTINALEEMLERLRQQDDRLNARIANVERQLAHLHEGYTSKDDEDKEKLVIKFDWNVGSGVFAVLVACCCCTCQLVCVLISCCGDHNIVDEVSTWCSCVGLIYKPLNQEDDIKGVVLREMRLMLLYPLLALMLSPWITCTDGAPTWAYFVFLPLVLRGKIVEFQILDTLGKKMAVLPLGFVLGVLDIADYLTDGIFPIQVYKCEPRATYYFAQSFQVSRLPFAAPFIATVHFWGMAVILLTSAILFQQACAFTDFGVRYKEELLSKAADAAGFGVAGLAPELLPRCGVR